MKEGETGSYVLRLTNGVRGGQQRVTGIAISINGVTLKGTAALTSETEFLDIPISLPLLNENRLRGTVTGPQGATVLVVIRDTPN